jgi:hypothetical protein
MALLPPRILVIYKPDDEDDCDHMVNAISPLGFRFVRMGEMARQEGFYWMGFEWTGSGVPAENTIVAQVKAKIPAAFTDACILFNPDPSTVKDTSLTFKDGKFQEIRH